MGTFKIFRRRQQQQPHASGGYCCNREQVGTFNTFRRRQQQQPHTRCGYCCKCLQVGTFYFFLFFFILNNCFVSFISADVMLLRVKFCYFFLIVSSFFRFLSFYYSHSSSSPPLCHFSISILLFRSSSILSLLAYCTVVPLLHPATSLSLSLIVEVPVFSVFWTSSSPPSSNTPQGAHSISSSSQTQSLKIK